MKRKLLTVFSLLLSLIGILLIGIACTPKEEFKPEEHEVVEEYYYDANGSEYLITLYTDDFFTLSIAGEEGQGKYALEDSTLTLTLEKKGGEIVATISDNVLNLTYKEVAYNFRLKVNYTVQFDAKGGTAVPDATVLNGKAVAEPTEPTKDGEEFIGWYTDEAFRNLYEFSRPVTGNLKLYARFVAPIDPEFIVKFDAGEGASTVDPMTTKGGKLYDPELPTPTKSGAKFVGWYVSQFYTAEKLSYCYHEQPIAENITLYAVWDDGNPVVSVEEDGVDVEVALGGRYSITITAPDGTKPVNGMSSTAAHYDYNFAAQQEGEYTIEVTIGGKTTVRHYHNKALARVSVYEVEESTIFFNAVPGATKYLLTVTCGTEGHTHENIPLGDTRSWSFANCDMPATGIKFVVTAEADGYVSSVSETFSVTRSLPAVTKVTVSSETEKATWDAVSGATSYFVTVLKGTEEVYAGNIGEATSFDLKYYAEGNYTIKVRPVARGWSSPADAACTYEKTRIATPKGLTYTGNSFIWEAVTGAEKYVVTIDGVLHESETTTLSLEGVEFNRDKDAIAITVCAVKGNVSSVASDAITVRATLGDIRYEDGKLSWDAVIGVTKYTVTVDGGEPIEVEGTSYDVTFTHAGDTIFTVSDGISSKPKELTVEAYEIKFEMDRQGASPLPSIYVADNDTIPYPEAPTFHGYTFEHWYTAPSGADGEGEIYDDATFRDRQTRTLYAGWTANEHTLTFDVGQYGEDLDVDSVKVRFGETKTVEGGNLPVPTSKNLTRAFAGWYLDANLRTQLTNFKGEIVTGGFLQDEDVKLYAAYVEVFKFENDEQGGVSVSKGPGIEQGIVTEVKIPAIYGGKAVTRINDFSNSPSLEVLQIPDTIQLIIMGSEGNAFAGCTSLRAIDVYTVEGNTDDVRYSSDDGVLIDTYLGQKMIRYYPAAKSGEYTIPDGVTVIPLGAFVNVTGLTKLSISYTVSQIQQGAFNGCTSLQEIEFLATPGGALVTELDIRDGAFEACDAIKTIHIPTRLTSVTAETFSALTNLESFTAEDGGKYSAIDGLLCTSYTDEEGRMLGYEIFFVPKGKDLGEYTIPGSIVSIGDRAFYEHPKLTGIIIPGNVSHIGKEAFGHIVDSANKASLTSITFKGTKEDPDLVIEEKAFYAGYTTASGGDSGTNTLVTALRLPANLVTLGKFAFGKYTNLKEVWIDTNRETIDYADFAFAADSTTNTSYVTTAHIGSACPAFSYSGVFGSKLASIDVDEANPYVKSKDDVVYDVDGANILFFPMDKGGSFEIPDGVLKIAPSAFADRDELVSISIPASVTEVGENAFNGCDELTTVTFRAPKEGDEAKPLEIKARAFYACKNLSTIELPERLEHLGTTVFYNCDALTSIHLPKSLKAIDQIANSSYQGSGTYLDIFQGCDKLKDVTVAEGNEYFAGINGVLYATKALRKGSATADLTNEPYEALYASPGATGTITVPGTVRIVRTYAFRGDFVGVKEIVFENLVDIYDEDKELITAEFTFQQYGLYATLLELKQTGPNSYTVDYNKTLEKIVLPEGIKTLSKNLIYCWKGLTSITIPSSVETIESGAFYGCENISSVTFAKTATGTKEVPLTIGDAESSSYGIFSNYSSVYANGKTTYYTMPIKSIVLPARTKYIGAYAFYYSEISSVTFDGDVSELQIGKYAFSSCEKLANFEIPDGTVLIGNNAFSYSGLTSIKMPDTVKYIGDYAFAYMKGDIKDETLVIPASTKMIGQYAFYSSDSSSGGKMYRYQKIDFSKAKDLELIGCRMYYNNSALTSIEFAKATDESPALTIGAYAFSQLSGLKSLHLPANISTIGAAYDMTGVTDGDIKVGDHFAKITAVGDVFYLDSALTEVIFDTFESGANQGKSMLASIETQAFRKSGLESLELPESTEADGIQLGTKLFIYCNSLTKVHLSKSVKSIDNVFTGCGKLQQVTVDTDSDFFSESQDPKFPALYDAQGQSVLFVYQAVSGAIRIDKGTRIGAGAFAGQTEITSVVIGPTVQAIDARAFENCINLQTVTFEGGSVLQSIGEYAFSGCYNLSSINLDVCTRLQTLGTYYAEVGKPGDSSYKAAYYYGRLFDGCDKLNINVTITSSDLENVGQYTFSYCGITGVDLSACTKLTELNNYAFAQNDALTSVKFPSSLEFLGTNTFANSDTIEEIDLSNTSIVHLSDVNGKQQTMMYRGKEDTSKDGAMAALFIFDCDSLEIVRLPATLRTIGYEAFMNSPALKEVYIGSDGAKNDLSSITWFGPKAFTGSGLPSIKIAGNATFADKYHGGTTSSYYVGAFEGAANLQKVEFEGGANLTSIPRGMFKSCTALSELDFTQLKNLTTIGQDAFRGCGFTSVDLSACKGGSSFMTATYTFAECANLSSVTLPANVTKVGNYTFMGTGFTTLDLANFSKVTTWGTYSFQNCLSLTEVNIPKGVTLAANLFDGCESLRTVTFGEGYKGTLPNNIFRNCAQLATLNLNGAVFTTLGTNVFQNCTALRSIDLSNSTATALGNYMFDGCENLASITVPATIKTAGTYTFRNCTSLTKIDLSNTKIDRFATGATGTVTATAAVHTFEGCTALQEVDLPAGITQIGGQVFLNCTSLTTIENLDISQLERIGKEAFRNCAYITGTVTLSDKLTILGEYAFADCYPTAYAISGSGTITGAKWGSNDVSFSIEAGLLIADENGVKTAVAFIANSGISGDTLKLKGDYAIAAYFFENFNVDGVTKLDLSELTATSLPSYALANSPFTEIVLPNTITELGTYMFQNSVNLTKVNIPAGLTALPNYCFDGCTSLASFTFPETLTATGTYAFRGTGLTSITIPETVENLGNYTFAETHELKSVTFTGNVETMGTYMFQNSENLTTVDLGPQATLSVRMFQGAGITSITVPATVTSVGNYAFVECHQLTSVTFAGALETLGTYVFQNCDKLNTVKLPEGLTALPNYIFNGCTALQQIEIPETVTSIGSHAFDGSGLTSIELSDAVDTINTYAFQNCVNLKGDIVLSDNVTTLGTYAFNGCTGITSIELSANVGTIANSVFGGWVEGQEIRVRNSRFETCASCGVAWLKDITAKVTFDYVHKDA